MSDELREPFPLPRTLMLFLGTLVGLTLACVLTELFCRVVLRLEYPYTWPLTKMGESVYDLNNYVKKFAAFHSSHFFQIEPHNPFAYPAPMALFYRLIYWVPRHRGGVLTSFTVLTFLFAAVQAQKALIRRGLFRRAANLLLLITLGLSYPLAFEIKQGNLEIFVFALLALGLTLFFRQSHYGAAVCFALAGSLKIFPLVFLGLLLARGRWRPVLLALLVAVGVTMGSFWLIDPNVLESYRAIAAGMATFQQKIVLHVVWREIAFDHSLFSVVKRPLWGLHAENLLAGVLRFYLPVAAVFGLVLYVFRIRFLPVVNQVLCLTLAAIMLPPVSYDYTLMHLYMPLLLLALTAVQANRAGRSVPALRSVMVLLAVALAPESEAILHGVSFGGQVKAPVLLSLFCLGLIYPFASSLDSQEQPIPAQPDLKLIGSRVP